MELREAKKELKSYIYNKQYIEYKLEAIEILTERINKVTASYSDMPKGGSSSKEDLIIKKIELETTIYAYLKDIVDLQLTIEKTVLELAQPYRNILTYHCLEGMSIEQTSEKVHYSTTQCKNRLKEAYQLYAKRR